MIDRPLVEPLRLFNKAVLAGHFVIEDRDTGTLSTWVPNLVQTLLFKTIMSMAEAGLPIRVVIPKARKMGVSTFVQLLFLFLTKYFGGRKALTYAHTEDDTKSIFGIAKQSQEAWGEEDAKITGSSIRFDEHKSQYECRTAGGKGVSRGSTIHFMHLSEQAFYTFVASGGGSIKGTLNAVPDMPHTIIIKESTGDGPQGGFHDDCVNAQKGIGSYRLMFFPWFVDERYQKKVPPDIEFTDDEREMQRVHQLTDEQLYWYRYKFEDACGDGNNAYEVALFKRDFPTVLSDCFAIAGGLIYPSFSERRNVARREIEPYAELYRGLDWGGTQEHPFVAIWVAHYRDRPPGLIISPDCKEVITEFMNYRRHPKSGKPVKNTDHDNDHSLDALRYLVMDKQLKGLVYVYRCYFNYGTSAMDQICRRVHELSGWVQPDDVDPADLSKFQRGEGEKYEATVADRNQPLTIDTWRKWGVEPIYANRQPSKTVRGEVEDGIVQVATLVGGNVLFDTPYVDPVVPLQEKLALASRGQRPLYYELTEEEEDLIHERREENAHVFNATDMPDGF